MTRLALVALILVAGRPAWCDVVTLRNGNEMEGLVTGENAREVVLDIGNGSVTLPRSSVARIRRSSGKAREALRRQTWLKRLESGEWVPPGAEELFRKYSRARALREDAAVCAKTVSELGEEQAALQEEVQSRTQRTSALYNERSANDQYYYYRSWRYRAAQAKIQENQGGIEAAQARLGEIQEQGTFCQTAQGDYLRALEEFLPDLRSRGSPGLASDPKTRDFLEVLGREARSMERDVSRTSARSSGERSEVVVEAVANGRHELRLLVDTGAGVTCLSPAAADRLGLKPDPRRRARVTVADGRTVDGFAVVLDSLAVGDSQVPNSPAIVLPGLGGAQDGLLGMSFLKHFSFSIDAEGGGLRLSRLK